MTQLKTLKDIDYMRPGPTPEAWIKLADVRQEAIKWVKQHRNIKPNWAKETNEEFFMAFFNLTEEELK
jgi:hypothetical protein